MPASDAVDSVLQSTARNILAPSADEPRAYRTEVAAAPPDDPHLGHAAMALADRLRTEATP